MPSPRRSSQYSQEMWDIVREVAQEGATQEIDLPTASRAAGVRARFYHFFAALRRDSEKPRPSMQPGEYERVREYARMADMVQLAVHGPKLIIRPRDTDPMSKVLATRTRVATEEVPMNQDALDKSLAKLQQKLKGEN